MSGDPEDTDREQEGGGKEQRQYFERRKGYQGFISSFAPCSSIE
jgi:hypothetical protein